MLRLITRIFFLFGLSGFSLFTHADVERFVVVGTGVIFSLANPSGWEMDTNSARNNGLPVVYYPSGQKWDSAPSVMYANTVIDDCRASFENFVNNDISDFRKKSKKLTVKDGGVMMADGRKAIIKLFSGDSFGNYEAVAYINSGDSVFISITLSSKNRQLFKATYPVFKDLIASFQFVGNSAGGDCKLPSFSERVALAKNAESKKDIYSYLYEKMFPAIDLLPNLVRNQLGVRG